MKALIVDDDRVLADVVAFTLRREGFEVIRAFDGETALQQWQAGQPDLVVLDVNLPKLDGFAVCQRIRQQADTPILLLTVRDDEDDIVRGLKLGADDYITKPFSPRQLVARAQAVLRRAGKRPGPTLHQVGCLTLDPSRREIHSGQNEVIPLTPLENRLLDYLMLNAGQVLTTETLLEHVWGAEGGDRDMLRQLVHRLRGKIAQAAPAADGEASLPRLETIAGLGYSLNNENLSMTLDT
jgi:DNA-binding response OmpR family regulator